MSPPPFDVVIELNRHAAALRSLAHELVDRHTADDAVQQVWLHALQRPPRHGAGIAGWFAIALRNVIGGWRRSERRRGLREDAVAAARGEAAEDHAVRLAREELAERLLAAVKTLEPAQRDAIWQRFFEGRAPRDIAVRSGVPLATVKSRLQRGLATLRQRLGEREGNDWRAGLAAAFGFGRTGTTAAAAIAGGVLMATWTKVSLGVAAAAAAVIAAMAWWPDPTAAAPVAAAGSSPPPVAVAGDLGAKAPDPRAEHERTAAGATNDPKLAIVRGRCVDANGAPLAACAARLFGWHNGGSRDEDWILEHGLDRVEHQTSTAADGRFEFAIEPPPPFQFALDVQGEGWAKAGFRWSNIEPGAVLDVGDLTMLPGVTLRGRIVDASGQPVGDVRVDAGAASRAGARGFAPCSFAGGRTAADGTFELDAPLAHGSYGLRVSDDWVVKSPVPLELAADSANGVRVVVTRADVPTITGTVVDEAGMPVRYPSLTWTNGAGESASQYGKADGTFELRCNSGDATRPVRIAVRVQGYSPVQHGEELRWGARGVGVRLQRSEAALTLCVRDREGRPLEGCTLRLHAIGSSSSGRLYTARARSDANGVATIASLAPGEYLVIAQFAASRGLPATIEPVVVDGSPARLELRIGAQPSRRLRVQRGDGTPVAGTRVQLCEMLGNSFGSPHQVLSARNWFVTNSTAPRILALVDAATDADGTLLLAGPGNRDLGLRVLGPGHTAIERADVRFDTAADLVVTVATGARVHGKVAPAAAVDELHRLAGVAVGEPFPAEQRPFIQLRRDKEWVPRVSHAAGDCQQFAMHDDGTFDVAGLPQGQWQVNLRYWVKSPMMTMSQDAVLATCALRDGESTAIEADLCALLPGTIHGVVLCNGEPWPKQTMSIVGSTGVGPDGKPQQVFSSVETDAEGRFALVSRVGRYELRGPDGSVATPAVDMVRGEVVSATFELALGELSVRLLTPDGGPAAHVEFLGATTDADGRMKVLLRPRTVNLQLLPRLRSSRGAQARMRIAPPAGSRPSAGWIELGQATVVAGKTTTLELRLPPEWEK